MGGQGGPIICDFAPIHYLLTDKIPIYCLPLQYQFSDYLPDSDKWTIGQLDKCPITKRTALCVIFFSILSWSQNFSEVGHKNLTPGLWLVMGFLLGWLIYGSVMVFGMEDLSQEDPSQPNYCQYMSAYIVTVISKLTLLKN